MSHLANLCKILPSFTRRVPPGRVRATPGGATPEMGGSAVMKLALACSVCLGMVVVWHGLESTAAETNRDASAPPARATPSEKLETPLPTPTTEEAVDSNRASVQSILASPSPKKPHASRTSPSAQWPPNGHSDYHVLAGQVRQQKQAQFTASLATVLEACAGPHKEVVINIAGGSFARFVPEWHGMVTGAGAGCAVVIALDEHTEAVLTSMRIPVVLLHGVSENNHGVGAAKFRAVAAVVGLGYHVLFTEMDVFWTGNILARSLRPRSEERVIQVTGHGYGHRRVNIGVFYIYSNAETILWTQNLSNFWDKNGSNAWLADQRVFDAFLGNYDRIAPQLLEDGRIPPVPKWSLITIENSAFHQTSGKGPVKYFLAAASGLRNNQHYLLPDVKLLLFDCSGDHHAEVAWAYRAALAISLETGRRLVWCRPTLGTEGWDTYRVVDMWRYLEAAGGDLMEPLHPDIARKRVQDGASVHEITAPQGVWELSHIRGFAAIEADILSIKGNPAFASYPHAPDSVWFESLVRSAIRVCDPTADGERSEWCRRSDQVDSELLFDCVDVNGRCQALSRAESPWAEHSRQT